jgi:hypothetical protein
MTTVLTSMLKPAPTGEPTPRPDHLNPEIKMEVKLDTGVVLCHCEDPLRVGSHKDRHVTFWPDKHCWVKFYNRNVFGVPDEELKANAKKELHVADGFVGETDYTFSEDKPTTAATGVTESPTPGPKSGPKIVVP